MAAMIAATTRRIIDVGPKIPNGPDGLRMLVSVRKETVLDTAFPARSTTVTFTVCVPSESPESVWEVASADRV